MMLVHDREALGGDALKKVLGSVLMGACNRLDEDDVLVWLGLLDIYPLPAERHIDGWRRTRTQPEGMWRRRQTEHALQRFGFFIRYVPSSFLWGTRNHVILMSAAISWKLRNVYCRSLTSNQTVLYCIVFSSKRRT